MEVEKVFKVTMLVVLLVCVICGPIQLTRALKDAPKAPDPMQEFNSRVEQNYTTYLDGEEVDPVKFDVTKYSVTYNDEAEAIYLTKRTETSGISSLVFIGFMVFVFLVGFGSMSRS